MNTENLLVRRRSILIDLLDKEICYDADSVSDMITWEAVHCKQLSKVGVEPITIKILNAANRIMNRRKELDIDVYTLLSDYYESIIECDYLSADINKDMIVNLLGLSEDYDITKI